MIKIQVLSPKHPSFLEYVKTTAFAQLHKKNIYEISRDVELSAENYVYWGAPIRLHCPVVTTGSD
jgi:hypothetical protein